MSYSRKSVREELLQKISEEVSKTVQQVKSKFHSLRTVWTREMKNMNSQWKFLKEMNFLKEVEEEDAWEDEEVSLIIDYYRGISAKFLRKIIYRANALKPKGGEVLWV